MPLVEIGEQLRERFQREKLHDVSQLPDLRGERLRFFIDIEGDTALERHYFITSGQRLVWHEPAGWEDWKRCDELKAFLKVRYGSRFVSLTPTTAAKSNLLGDNIDVSLDPS